MVEMSNGGFPKSPDDAVVDAAREIFEWIVVERDFNKCDLS